MSSEVGVGHLSVFPVMTGFKKKVLAETSSAGDNASKGFDRAFKGTGARIGARLGKETKKAFSNEAQNLPSSNLKSLQAEVAKATRALARDRLRLQDSAGAVRVAEARLAETMSRYPAESSQVIAAEERLAAARRRHANAVDAVESASNTLKASQTAVAKAQDLAGASTQKLSERLRGLKSRFSEGYREGSKNVEFTRDFVRASGRLLSGVSAIGRASDVTQAGMNRVSSAVASVKGGFARFGASAAVGAKGAALAVTRHLGPLGPFVQTVGSGMVSALGSGMGRLASAGRSGMGAVVSGIGAVSSRIPGLVASSMQAATGVMSVALASATAFVASFSGEALAASDATNKFRSTLDFAGLDTSTIDNLAKSTQGYADRTVYDLSDIQNITAQLASNGVEGYDRLAEAAGNLNAVAGGNKTTFRSVGMVMTQTAGAGKLMTENWRQLADAIPGAAGPLKRALSEAGAYTGDFQKAMEAGEISAEEFNQAILKLGFEDAAIEAASSTATFEGAWGNFVAAVVGGIVKIVEPLKGSLTSAITTAANAVEAGFSKIAGIVKGVVEIFRDGDFNPETWGAGMEDSPLIDFLFTLRENAKSVIAGLAPLLGGLGGMLGPLLSKIPLIGGAFTGLTGPVGLFVGALGGLLTMSPGLRDALGDLASGILTSLQDAFMMLAPILGQVSSALADAAGVIGPGLGVALTGILPVVTEVIGLVGELAAQVLPLLLPVIEQIAIVISQLAPVVADVISTVLPPLLSLAQALIPVIVQIVSAISEVVNALLPLLVPLTELIASILPPLIDLFQAVLPPVIAFASAIIDGLMPVIQGLISILQGVVDFVTGVFTGNWSQAWSGIKQVFSGFVDAIKGLISGGLRLAFESIPGLVKGVFVGAGSWLIGIGRSIIQGLIDGIKSAIGGVRDALQSLTASIPDWKGPKEVDDVLLVDAGHRIMGGLQRAIEEDQEQIKRSLQVFTGDLGSQNVSPAKSGQGNLSAGGFPASVTLKVGEREFEAFLEAEQVRFARKSR